MIYFDPRSRGSQRQRSMLRRIRLACATSVGGVVIRAFLRSRYCGWVGSRVRSMSATRCCSSADFISRYCRSRSRSLSTICQPSRSLSRTCPSARSYDTRLNRSLATSRQHGRIAGSERGNQASRVVIGRIEAFAADLLDESRAAPGRRAAARRAVGRQPAPAGPPRLAAARPPGELAAGQPALAEPLRPAPKPRQPEASPARRI